MNKQGLLKSAFTLLFILLCSGWVYAQQPIRVACIGNSITYGSTGQHIYFKSMKEFLDNAWSGFVAEDDKITSYSLADPIDNYGGGLLVDINHAK